MDVGTILKAFTRVMLMLPIPVVLVIGSILLVRKYDMGGYVQFVTAFSAVYVPALTAYITGTSLKRAQEKGK